MSTTFYATPDNAQATTTGYTQGSGSIALSPGDGEQFGSSFPLLISTFFSNGTPKGIYFCTGRSGDTLTGLTLVSGTDATLPAGATVAVRWSAEHVAQYAAAVNALEALVAGSSSITTVGTIAAGTWQGTAVAVPYGGTGATTAAAARSSLGLAIGTNVLAPRRDETVVFQDFSVLADGAAPALPTGQSWSYSVTGGGTYSAETPLVASGLWTLPSVNPSGGSTTYGQIDAGRSPAAMGATIVFGADSGDKNGGIALISSPVAGVTFGAIDQWVHLICNVSFTRLEVVTSNSFISLGQHNYASSLAQDGATPYRVSITFNGNTATVHCPDGATLTATDSRIGSYTGRHLIYELFYAATNSNSVAFRDLWATARDNSLAPAASYSRDETLSILGAPNLGPTTTQNLTVNGSGTVNGTLSINGTTVRQTSANPDFLLVQSDATAAMRFELNGGVLYLQMSSDGGATWGQTPVQITKAGQITLGSSSGLAKLTSGVLGTATAGTDYLAPAGNGSALTGLTQSQVSGLTSALAAKALDSAVVHTTGTETIAGAKTFSTAPVLASLTGLLKGASGTLSAAAAGTDYLAPSGNGSALTGITQSQVTGLKTTDTPTFAGLTVNGATLLNAATVTQTSSTTVVESRLLESDGNTGFRIEVNGTNVFFQPTSTAFGDSFFPIWMTTTGHLGFHATTPIAKPTVTGSRGGNAALASLLTQLASYGLITDSSS